MANSFYNYINKIALFLIALLLCGTYVAQAQVIWASPTGTAWLTASNWTGGIIPSATQVAQFNANPTSATFGVGINMDTAGGALSAAAVYISPLRANNLIIGNSAPTTPGILTLTGATVNTTPNVILANLASNTAKLTLQNTQGSGGSILDINVGAGAKNIIAGAGTTIAFGNTISISNTISGSAALTFLGSGTWTATTATGNNGGLLRLGGNNTNTGGITVGAADGTQSGILELDSTTAINNVAGNNITINPNSQLYLAAPAGSSYAVNNVMLHLNGNGNNAAATGKGALVNLSNVSYTWASNIDLASDAGINVASTATISLTLTGNISGTGQLIKNGAGNLILGGTGNTWAGGTQLTNGKLTINAGSSICNGPLLIAQQGNNPSIIFNNTTQTITSLSSSFTGSTATNSVVLNGTRLIINQNTNTAYGGNTPTLSGTITGTGAVVKTGTGMLTLTSPANTFSGGLNLTAGEIRLNPNSGTAATCAGPDTLNGGILSTNGISRAFTFTFGTLALTENSTIDLGTDTMHIIRFAASSAINWTAGKQLTITHWTGSWNSTAGTRGRIYFGTNTTAITATQLSQIKFIDASGNIYNATLLSSGELVPLAPSIVTTPATYGPFCSNIDNFISVAFAYSPPVTGTFYVQLSSPTGVFANDFTTGIIGSGTTSPITATIPAGTAAGTGYRIRVINPTPTNTFGTNNGSNIVVNGTPVLPAITGSPIVPLGGNVTFRNTTAGGTWSSVNPSVASVNATTGVVTGVSIGSTVISYSYTNFCGFTGYSSASITVVAVPTITSVTPNTGKPGSTVTITGTNFNITATNNIVLFGAIKATVTAASATSLSVTVPVNAQYAVVSVTDITTGLTASEQYAFTPTYDTTGLIVDSVNFKPSVNFTTGATPVGVCMGDLDGDGKPDMVVINSGPNNMYIYRNTTVAGAVNTTSFATPVSYVTGLGPHYARIADLDGDGKPEIIVANVSASSNSISIYKNTSVSGTISFAAKVDLSAAAAIDLSVADFDGDGKQDIAIVLQNSSKVSVLRNIGTAGSITSTSFAPAVLFATGSFPFRIYTGDLDGDNKPDIAVTSYLSNSITVLHNNAVLGAITTTSFSTTTSLSTGVAPSGIAAGDLDGDGKNELVVTNNGDKTISVFRNNYSISGTMAFASAITYATDSIPEDLALADVDGDGKLDIAVGNYGSDVVAIYHNNAVTGALNATSFSARKNLATGNAPAGIAFTDIDSDGKPDLIVANGNNSSVAVFKNYPLPRIGATTGAHAICIGTNTTLANSVPGGTWVSSNPAIATVNNTGLVHAIAAGIDTITYYTVAQGDTNTVDFVLTVDSYVAVSPIAATHTTICAGAASQLTDTAAHGSWVSNNAAVATVDTTGFVTGISTSTVIITYTVTTACNTSTDTILLNVTPTTGYSIGAIIGPSTLCAGTSATLSDTTAGGTWASSQLTIATVSNTGVVYGITYGTSIITYALSNACGIYQDTHSVSIDSTLHADSVHGPSSVCVGALITLTDAAGTGGTWAASNSNATVTPAGVVTGVSAGTTTITYIISNTCGTATGTKTITINPQPDAGTLTGAATVCPSDTITVTTTATGGTWSVSNANAASLGSGKIRGLLAGGDTVRYIVINGCGADTATLPITVLPAPNAGTLTGLTVVCPGASITIRATVTGGTWSITNAQATIADSIVTGVAPGVDTVRYTYTNTCGTATVIKAITVNTVTPVASITGPSSVCVGFSISLANATDSGTWSRTNTRATVSATGIVTGVSTGIDTIKYTPRGTCPMIATKEITINPGSASATITSAATVCVGASITLRSNVAGGVWSSANANATVADSILTGVTAGTDSIVYAINSECGIATIIKKITINPLPYADEIVGTSSLYVGDLVTLKDSTAGGIWSVEGTNALINSAGRLGALKVGVDTVRYTVTNSCGVAIAKLPINIASAATEGNVSNIHLFPNPNTGSFTVTVSSLGDENVNVVISNAAYQVINVLTIKTNTPTSMDFNLANGVYLLSVVSPKGWYTTKFVIAK